jgi:hypothetical protein
MMIQSFAIPAFSQDGFETTMFSGKNDKNSSVCEALQDKNDPENTITECIDAMHSVCSQWFLNGTNPTTVRQCRIMQMHKE